MDSRTTLVVVLVSLALVVLALYILSRKTTAMVSSPTTTPVSTTPTSTTTSPTSTTVTPSPSTQTPPPSTSSPPTSCQSLTLTQDAVANSSIYEYCAPVQATDPCYGRNGIMNNASCSPACSVVGYMSGRFCVNIFASQLSSTVSSVTLTEDGISVTEELNPPVQGTATPTPSPSTPTPVNCPQLNVSFEQGTAYCTVVNTGQQVPGLVIQNNTNYVIYFQSNLNSYVLQPGQSACVGTQSVVEVSPPCITLQIMNPFCYSQCSYNIGCYYNIGTISISQG